MSRRPRRITTKYPSLCNECGLKVPPGAAMWWYPDCRQRFECVNCEIWFTVTGALVGGAESLSAAGPVLFTDAQKEEEWKSL